MTNKDHRYTRSQDHAELDGKMQQPSKMPREMRHRPSPNHPGTFQVLDARGSVWADAIPTEDAARVFASAPPLLLGYEWLLEEALQHFHARWRLTMWGPGFDDFVHDDGELDRSYPGAPAHAIRLNELMERARMVRTQSGEHPVEPYRDPQSELF